MSEKSFLQNIIVNKHYRPLLYLSTVFTIFVGFLLMFAVCDKSSPTGLSDTVMEWVGTWRTATQPVLPYYMPPNPGLTNNTLRQIVCVSLGGDSIQVRFSNEYGESPVTFNAVHIAVSGGGSFIRPETDKALTFSGDTSVIIDAGTTIISDPLYFEMEPRTNVAITIYFGELPENLTGHHGSRTYSYIVEGNAVSSIDFSNAKKKMAWYYIAGIDVMAD
ncbi:SGNH/GDSL hydrolase family protein, partial [bacterium]